MDKQKEKPDFITSVDLVKHWVRIPKRPKEEPKTLSEEELEDMAKR